MKKYFLNYLLNKRNRKIELAMTYTNQEVIDKISKELNYTNEESINAFNELKKFLYLCSINSSYFTPSRELDKVWHQFILFTSSYDFYCRKILGKFINHYPNDNKNANFEGQYSSYNFALTQFKTLDPKYWVLPNTIKMSTDCGDCGSNEYNPEAPENKIKYGSCRGGSKKGGGGCYIATHCYSDYNAPEVLVFRNFRDEFLQYNLITKNLVILYYSSEKYLSRFLKSSVLTKLIKKYFLDKFYIILLQLY
jgi:hypothetical protein